MELKDTNTNNRDGDASELSSQSNLSSDQRNAQPVSVQSGVFPASEPSQKISPDVGLTSVQVAVPLDTQSYNIPSQAKKPIRHKWNETIEILTIAALDGVQKVGTAAISTFVIVVLITLDSWLTHYAQALFKMPADITQLLEQTVALPLMAALGWRFIRLAAEIAGIEIPRITIGGRGSFG